MLPEINVRRPSGLRAMPKVAVRQRKVIDYEPSWMLLAVPALLALRSRRRKAGAKAASSPAPQAEAYPSGAVDTTVSAPPQRRRARQIIIIPVARLRRRPGGRIDLDEAAAMSAGRDGARV